jgi:hypothetical protein
VRNFVPGLLVSAAAALFLCRSSSASLTINLQFADGTTQYHLTPSDSGNTIPINVWATVTTPTPLSANNYNGLQFIYYDVLSSVPNGGQGTPGGSTAADGQLTSASLTPIFNANGSQDGSIMDANGDGALDLGPDTSPNQFTNVQQMVLLAKARSSNPVFSNQPDPGSGGYSVSFLIEQLDFQVNSDNGVETDFSTIIPTLSNPYEPANWFEDVPSSVVFDHGNQGVGTEYTQTAPILAGTGVQIFGNGAAVVPEPASISLIAIGCVGLLTRRRRRN